MRSTPWITTRKLRRRKDNLGLFGELVDLVSPPPDDQSDEGAPTEVDPDEEAEGEPEQPN